MKSVMSGFGVVLGLMAQAFVLQPSHAQQAAAIQPGAVVELFTSQGCSSCPPADKLFVELARDPKLIVLTLPVDYWDYLGWKDTLAQPGFSSRQRHYAQTRGDNTVYTPQAVVNGGMHVVGSDRAKIAMLSAKSSLSVAVSIEEGADSARIHVAASAVPRDTGKDALKGNVFLVPVMRSSTVTIARGENRGKEIAYANVARGIHRLGDWTGDAVSFDVTAAQYKALVRDAAADGFVVLLQADTKKSGKIFGAARSKGLTPPSS